MKKGHITVTLSLILLVTLSLFFAMVHAAKLAAGRAAAALALDDALFSLFSCYDRDLLDAYGVFFLDGSAEGSTPALSRFLAFTEDAASYGLQPQKGTLLTAEPLLTLSPAQTEILSYTLAGEGGGAVFLLQAKEMSPLFFHKKANG